MPHLPISPSQRMLELVGFKVTAPFVSHLAEITFHAFGGKARRKRRFFDFVHNTTRGRLPVSMSVLLVTLVYIKRAESCLRGQEHDLSIKSVFLGALILAYKYTNDSSPKSYMWETVTGTYNKRRVNEIERKFIQVLDWQLGFTEQDITAYYDTIVEHCFPSNELPPLPVPNAPVRPDQAHVRVLILSPSKRRNIIPIDHSAHGSIPIGYRCSRSQRTLWQPLAP